MKKQNYKITVTLVAGAEIMADGKKTFTVSDVYHHSVDERKDCLLIDHGEKDQTIIYNGNIVMYSTSGRLQND